MNDKTSIKLDILKESSMLHKTHCTCRIFVKQYEIRYEYHSVYAGGKLNHILL
jgi:hypothetical protein